MTKITPSQNRRRADIPLIKTEANSLHMFISHSACAASRLPSGMNVRGSEVLFLLFRSSEGSNFAITDKKERDILVKDSYPPLIYLYIY